MLVKSLGVPNLLHTMNAISVPISDIQAAGTLLFNYLWKSKKHHIKNNTLIGEYFQGGLKMTDLETVNRVSKLTWIIRIMETNYYSKELF